MCITELCNATGHDIRASINNLQFAAIRSRNQHSIDQQQQQHQANHHHHHHHHHHHPSKNMMDIGRVLQNMIRSGLKDGQLDLFQIWKSIFTVQSPASTTQQQSTSIQSLVEDEANAVASRTQQQLQVKVDCSMKVMDSMQSYGDHQQVISGIFENIHSIDPLDPAFTKHAIGSDWVSFVDELQSFMPIARDGFQLQPYIASVAGAVYCHNSLNRRITLSWPKKDREMHYRGASKQSILQSLLDGSDIHSLRISKNVSPTTDLL
jgi:hypothetical protein